MDRTNKPFPEGRLLSLYVERIANYGAYGAFGGVMVVVLWFYVSALVVLLGAALNRELTVARLDRSRTSTTDQHGRRDPGGASAAPLPAPCDSAGPAGRSRPPLCGPGAAREPD